MNLMDLFIKIGVDDQASSKIETLSSKLGNGLKKAAEIGVAAMTAAGAGIAALGKASIDAYADYEQLVGGVETLFKKSAPKVQKYASEAYKTAGLSANEYMETVTSFSASLLQSLEQDTEAAAEYADVAIRDMSDNANKMGTDMSMIQNAYQGFAKDNYTMLDNLKLGYGGTQEEMKRLIADAAELSDTVDAQSLAFDNVVKAIHVVQDELGITGTTAKEAGATISGSISSMKAAWENLKVGIADENADIGQLFDDLVVSIVGDGSESNRGALGNLLPRVEQVFKGIGTVADVARPYIEEGAVKVLDYFGVKMADGEQINASLFDGANGIVSGLATLLTETDALDKLSGSMVSILNKFTEAVTKDDSLAVIGGGALTIISKLAGALAEKAPEIVTGATSMLVSLIDGFFTEDNIKSFSDGAVKIITTLGGEIEAHKAEINAGAKALANAISSILVTFEWDKVGRAIGELIGSGIGSIGEWIGDLAGLAGAELGAGLEYLFSGEVSAETAEMLEKYGKPASEHLLGSVISGLVTSPQPDYSSYPKGKLPSVGLPGRDTTVWDNAIEKAREEKAADSVPIVETYYEDGREYTREIHVHVDVDGDELATTVIPAFRRAVNQKGISQQGGW